MDLRQVISRLTELSEGTMSSAEKKPRGPKFTGKWKGTDSSKEAKGKYVGGGMEESIMRELEQTLQNRPHRDIQQEYKRFTSKWCGVCGQSPCNCTYVKEGSLSKLEVAVTESGKKFIYENPPTPAIPVTSPGASLQKPQLGADVSKQDKAQADQAAQMQAQADAAKKAAAQQVQQKSTLTKGVNILKQAGAAISNASQTVQALNKVDSQEKLNPSDKNNVASAGTVLAPIMSNPSLAGKFKSLVDQASADEKKQQAQAQQEIQPQQAQQPKTPAQPAPAGTVK